VHFTILLQITHVFSVQVGKSVSPLDTRSKACGYSISVTAINTSHLWWMSLSFPNEYE